MRVTTKENSDHSHTRTIDMGYGRYRRVNMRKTTPTIIPQCEVKKLMKRQSGKPKRRFGVRTACNVPPMPQKYATSNHRWLPVHIATITTTMPQSHICNGNICRQSTTPWLRIKIK